MRQKVAVKNLRSPSTSRSAILNAFCTTLPLKFYYSQAGNYATLQTLLIIQRGAVFVKRFSAASIIILARLSRVIFSFLNFISKDKANIFLTFRVFLWRLA